MNSWSMSRLWPVYFGIIALCASSPLPDNSEQCKTCEARVSTLQDLWTNSTSVSEILKNLEAGCAAKFPDLSEAVKLKLCDDVAKVFVQIPPSLFKGMEDLAWPVPEALCATFYQCEVFCCGQDDPPEQVHLSLASNDLSVMGVSWVTLNEKASIVEYGLNQRLLSQVAMGSVSTYRAAGWRGAIHRAVMNNLKQDTTYYYRVGNGQRWSEIFSFHTLRDGQDITFAVLADMDFDSNDTISNLADLVKNNKIQAVIHSGDISYADGYEAHWDTFFRRIEPIAAHVPYMVSPGNHEFWYNFTSYKHRFFMPGDPGLGDGGSGDGMFFSWKAGSAHLISGNSETAVDTANFSKRFVAWLEQDLKAVDRSVTPFVIAHFHRPMYCSNNDACTSKGGDRLRAQAEQLLYDYKVNLVLVGHVHSYERTFPLYNNTASQFEYTNPTASVHILQGGSGNREGNDNFPDSAPSWSAAHAKEVGYGLMTVTGKQIDFEYYASASEENGGPKLLDSFTMGLWK